MVLRIMSEREEEGWRLGLVVPWLAVSVAGCGMGDSRH
jgi:hypothetical protein